MSEEQEIQNFVRNAIYLKKNNYLEYIKIKSFLEGMETERKSKEREKKC
ncbi:hypothetical protein QTH02_14180 [Clostridium perfringens]|nr:hypothetical protein [Clostridium perfringens]